VELLFLEHFGDRVGYLFLRLRNHVAIPAFRPAFSAGHDRIVGSLGLAAEFGVSTGANKWDRLGLIAHDAFLISLCENSNISCARYAGARLFLRGRNRVVEALLPLRAPCAALRGALRLPTHPPRS
jgi:hypothetical protein